MVFIANSPTLYNLICHVCTLKCLNRMAPPTWYCNCQRFCKMNEGFWPCGWPIFASLSVCRGIGPQVAMGETGHFFRVSWGNTFDCIFLFIYLCWNLFAMIWSSCCYSPNHYSKSLQIVSVLYSITCYWKFHNIG